MVNFGFFSYGHSRVNADLPRNSVILTNWGAYNGCKNYCTKQGYNFFDLSPIIPDTGIDWSALGKVVEKYKDLELDVLYCQASVSLELIQAVIKKNPSCHIILQRDSTHAAEHLRLMKGAMEHDGFVYEHSYESNGKSLLNRELAEYLLSDNIFVLSNWVKSTFDKHGLGVKAVKFSSQCSDKELWYDPNLNFDNKPKDKLHAVFAGQLGLRKGVFTLLEGWRKFWTKHPDSVLHVCGLPEHGIPEKLKHKVNQALKDTPGIQYYGWVDMRQMAALYKQCHLMVIPSVEEGSTMTGVEAAMCGAAIIATENAGIDLLEHGATGWVIPPLDAESLSESLTGAYNNKTLLRTYSEEIHRRAASAGVEEYAKSCENTLAQVLGPILGATC